MPVSDWALLPPRISTINKVFQEISASTITPEVHIKLETASPDTEIFFSTDGSIPDPLNLNVLSATKTYRYKNPFKLKPGTRTVQAVSVSRSTGAKSETSSQTFDVVVTADLLGKKHYTSDTQIYSNSKYTGGNTYRVDDMNYRNHQPALYEEQLRTVPRTAYLDHHTSGHMTSTLDPEVSEFFSTHNTQHRIAALSHASHTALKTKTDLYDDIRASAPYLRKSTNLTSQGQRLTQSSIYENHRRPLSPDFQGHRRSPSPVDHGRKSPAYEIRKNAYLDSQVTVHDQAKREKEISERLQREERTAELETEEEELLAELERKYQAEKARQPMDRQSHDLDDDPTPRYSDLIGPETSRLLEDTRVRFEEGSEWARTRLADDMRQRDELADLTGNQLRYSTRLAESQLRGQRSRSRSPSPSRRSRQYRTSQPCEEMHAPRKNRGYTEREKLEHLLLEHDSARDRNDLESMSELESEIESYRRSLARKQQPLIPRSRSKSPQRRGQLSPSESTATSELDDLFIDRERGTRRYDRGENGALTRDLKGEKGEKDKAETEKMEKLAKKDKKDQKKDKKIDKKKDKEKKKKDNSDSSSSDSESSSSSATSVWSKSDKPGKEEKKKPVKTSKEESPKKPKEKEKEKSPAKPTPKTPKSVSSSKTKAPVTPKTPFNTARTDVSSMSSARSDTSRVDTSRSEMSKAPSVQPMKQQAMKPRKGATVSVQKRPKEPTHADSALNFLNDSGTQINFWGAPPKEILDSMKGMFPKVKPTPNGSKIQGPQEVKATKAGVQKSGVKVEELVDSDSDESELNEWFSPTRGVTKGPKVQPKPEQVTLKPSTSTTKLTKKSLSQTAPAKLSSSGAISPASPKSNGLPVATGPVSATQQTEQESIGGFFKKLFKTGWGSSEKSEKAKDPRQTVRAVSDKSGVTYQQLKSKSLKKGDLYEDPDFPCDDSSLYFSEKPVSGNVEWKRPHEICKDPQMFVGGASRFDIMQGVLGNCWLLAAMASLTTDQKLLHRVVPADQSFSKDYAGIFRFRIWQYGQWLEVVIDDRLPTYKGSLIYMHSTETNEFWSPLLEKAYAKLVGCYQNLTGGLQSEAMTDFTAGVCERYNFREEMPDNMFQILYKARQRGALMGCSIDAGTFKAKALPGKSEEELENGLIVGHAYSITDVKQLETRKGVVQLVRCRNPWGTEHEWNGAWSDQSSEWQSISEKNKQELGLKFEHDGEFWMDFRDFSANFQRVEICNLGPDDMVADSDGHVTFKCQTLHGCWKKNVNAGGCRNFPKSFHTNPQYRVELIDVDDDDEEDVATLIVALMQKGRRRLKKTGQGNLTIGYDIYDVEDADSGNLGRDFFLNKVPVDSAPQYINMREVVGRHRLPPSQYCIIPTTFEPDEEADLVIRAFTESEAGEVVESDEATCFVQPKTSSLVQSSAHMSLNSEADEQFEAHGGEDGEIDASELKQILDAVFTKAFQCGGFPMPLCRSLLTSRDTDGQGKLNLEEFRLLWSDLTSWKNIFKEHDQDNSGKFNSTELREALKSCGFQVSNATFRALVPQYSDEKGCVDFDDFVACLVKLKERFSAFHSQQAGSQGAEFNMDEFVQLTMSS